MIYCNECRNTEPGFTMQKDEMGDDVWVCDICAAEDSKRYLDEDALRERLQEAVWNGPEDAA